MLNMMGRKYRQLGAEFLLFILKITNNCTSATIHVSFCVPEVYASSKSSGESVHMRKLVEYRNPICMDGIS